MRSTIDASGAIALLTVSIATVLGLLDIRIKKERALLGNLGISQPLLASLFAMSAVAGELVLAFGLALL